MTQIILDPELVGAQFDFFEDDTSRFLHLSAGFGFGKTHALIYKLLKLSMLNINYDGGLICPSFTDYKRDVLPSLEGILDRHNIPFQYHGTEHWFRFPWSNGLLRVLTAEKKLRGPNLAYIGINELGLVPIERYREAIGRVRVKGAKCAQVVSSGTPDQGIASPYYTVFVEQPWEGSRILYGDTNQNAHNLDKHYIPNLLNTYPSQLIQAYLKGEWVNLNGAQFYFSYDHQKNKSDKIPKRDEPFLIGVDFNVDPMCANVWQRFGKELHCVDEIVLSGGQGYNTANLVTALEARGYGPANSTIFPDPAGQARSTKGKPDVHILREAGYHVVVRASAPRLRERQLNINNLFDKKVLFVNQKLAPKLHKDLIAVEVDPITLEKIKKNHELTHASDAMDYLVSELYPFNGHRSSTYTVGIR